MNTIHITHNPFIVDTVFLINGQSPASSCALLRYKESRLQQWIESIFGELAELFNDDRCFHVVFRGVESDWLDVQDAAENARRVGMDVELDWEVSEPVEQRIEKIKNLIEDAYNCPDFAEYINGNELVKSSIEEALDRNFDVYVVATMSSGKSTLINAMLGHDLLPALNEATTATIARILDRKDAKGSFNAKRYNHHGEQIEEHNNASLELIQQWNNLKDTKSIEIEGNILAVEQRADVRLVLTDTPGPNNSQNEEHQRTTMGFIQDSKRNPLILYVLNAQQLGIKDDSNLLKLVSEKMKEGGKQSRDRFIFVVNKMDVFDPEKGECVESVLHRVRLYLQKQGIANPLIYPVSASLMRLIRKPPDLYTRKERADFQGMADLFSEEQSMNLLKYMPITSHVKKKLEEKQISQLMLSSGMPAIEMMIDEYIDKYNLPHRLKRVHDALETAIAAGLNAADINIKLEKNQKELGILRNEISELQKRRERSFDTAAYKNRIEREGIALPKETIFKLNKLQQKGGEFIMDMQKEFQDEDVSEQEANQRISRAVDDIKCFRLELINAYEQVFSETQERTREHLKSDYKKYIAEIFDGVKDLNLPILRNIQQSVEDIPFNISLDPEKIKHKEVITGSREVSVSTWYKPWTWGDTKVVHDYKTVQYVNLNDVWRDRVYDIEVNFRGLLENARKEIESCKQRHVQQYFAFMSREFDVKFEELLESIRGKINDQETREKAVADAKRLQAWIRDFESKLGGILKI